MCSLDATKMVPQTVAQIAVDLINIPLITFFFSSVPWLFRDMTGCQNPILARPMTKCQNPVPARSRF